MYFCTKISLTMRSNIFRLLLLLLPTIALAQETTKSSLIINEVQVANLDQYLDNANCYGSWIELYNPTDTAISMNGMFLTDGVNRMRFVSAHGSVPAKGFKAFWFGHYYSEGNYGSNARRQIPYKLDYEGGTITLQASNISADGKTATVKIETGLEYLSAPDYLYAAWPASCVREEDGLMDASTTFVKADGLIAQAYLEGKTFRFEDASALISFSVSGDYDRVAIAGTERPGLRFTTSDVGISGANLFPILLIGNGSRIVPLGYPIKTNHKSGADLDYFEEQISLLYARFTEAIEKQIKLLEIEIRYPSTALLGVLKRIGAPKRASYEALDSFLANNGDRPCTAYELYLAMSEVIFITQCEGASGSRIAQLEEIIARALHVNWSEYDRPGAFAW